MLLFAESSSIVTAFSPDETDHDRMRILLLGGPGPVVASELVRLEFVSAVSAAARDRRIADGAPLIARFDAECAPGGRLKLLALRGRATLARAAQLVQVHRLRSLDAIHLAVALEDGLALTRGEQLLFVTRDARQAAAARALGLSVLS